ncbi:MAG TPA: PfkB family carbohydrate kinase [Rhodanobacteraceae bacterium]|nr:PfkB family carbohydrate kinase [Rhodanobacteraceae bacterium]
MFAIVGGIYRELCMHPRWNQYFGSGGRAAAALAALGVPVTLYSYADGLARSTFESMAALDPIQLALTDIPESPGFHYIHGLSVPVIKGLSISHPSIHVDAEHVLRFGMIEGEGVVSARRAVYDPQNARNPRPFHENGSKSEELALILNRHEAGLLLGERSSDATQMARTLAERNHAQIVVIKQGPMGALVLDRGRISEIPAYGTQRVWKIGSGDQFAAQFAVGWMHMGLNPHDAADRASRSTAYYCEHHGSFPSEELLVAFQPAPLIVGERWRRGERPTVYLAGPFFNLAQLWLVEQARTALMEMHLKVFSPYHDVGRGSAEDVVELDLQGIRDCDVLLALGDGLDAGTIYEIGYARAIGRPVVMYSECESIENRKMMQGSDCILTDDFVSAIYRTVWVASHG